MSKHPESFEGRVVLVTGHDPEQGQGTFPILHLDAPLCTSATDKTPQLEIQLAAPGGTEAFAKKWDGKRVRVSGELRSMQVYAHPIRPFLLWVTTAGPVF